jgi:hypothetical protein
MARRDAAYGKRTDGTALARREAIAGSQPEQRRKGQGMEITLTISERCGHHDAVRDVIREAMAEAGVTDVEVKETVIRSEEDAIATKCLGSPTLRVDGYDVEYQEREPAETSPGCRYFNTPAGWKPVPEKGMIVRALEKAKERAGGS